MQHAPSAHLKRTLHQELRVKSEHPFLEKHSFPGKCLPFLKILGHFREKKLCTQVPTGPESPLPLNVNSSAKNYIWLVRALDVFTNRVLVEKHERYHV